MTEPDRNYVAINLTNLQNTYDEQIRPTRNRKFYDLIKKSLLLTSTLTGVAIGTLIGA